MKMEADGAVQPGHHVARRKTCFRERSREMLEDICVFETSGSCTPGDAGSGPSNLAVLIVNSQHGTMKVRPGDLFSFLSFNFWGVQSLPCVSGEGEVGKSVLMSKAKVMPCRSLSPASGWGWWWDGGMSWQLGLWEDAGPLASLALMYEQLEAAHPPPTSGKIPNNARRQRRREYRMLQIAEEQISSFSAGRQMTEGCWYRLLSRREVRRVQGARVDAMIAAPLQLPLLLSPKVMLLVWSEGSEVTALFWKGLTS